MPAMVRWPGKIRPGSTSIDLVATYDIFATMVSLAGASLPKDRLYDGIDISPVFFETPGATGHECIFNYKSGASLAVVRCGKWKVHFDKTPVELFDLDADIGEQHPLPSSTPMWSRVVNIFAIPHCIMVAAALSCVHVHSTKGPYQCFI
jgi:arylsulfatase A-like enzyme